MELVTLTEHHLQPDPSRVLPRLFVAGQDNYGTRQTRGTVVLNRIMELSEQEVALALGDVEGRFGERHTNLNFTLDQHAQRLARKLLQNREISDARWKLIGATFTMEYAIEGASLSNPSAVLHPVQASAPEGSSRFVMTTRCIGEGHRSSIGFRAGRITSTGEVTFEPVKNSLSTGTYGETPLFKRSFTHLLTERDMFGENAQFVLDDLGHSFSHSQLEVQLNRLQHNRDTFLNVDQTIRRFREIAERSYSVRFSPDTDISERVLWPLAAVEEHGMEDARCVRFTNQDGSVTYLATYTAFDGFRISQQIARTKDFLNFTMHPVSGSSAGGKGLAIFPRKLDGKYVALTRADHESNSIVFSETLEHWDEQHTIQVPRRPWELIQLGNCGSPIETDRGWLVLTHAVGPMRTYYISALLLDLHDPTKVLASLDEPLISPSNEKRNGYVPNVVYSCGSLRVDDTLMIPFGIADQSIGVSTAKVSALVDALLAKA
jgi:predicted GH43/DUF377 family glycosyl hydrolase